jgi:hypothetical protein
MPQPMTLGGVLLRSGCGGIVLSRVLARAPRAYLYILENVLWPLGTRTTGPCVHDSISP